MKFWEPCGLEDDVNNKGPGHSCVCCCSLPKDTQPGLLRAKDGAKKLMDMGLEFIPMEQIIKDAVESLKSKGFIP